jgi:hypothetical protein
MLTQPPSRSCGAPMGAIALKAGAGVHCASTRPPTSAIDSAAMAETPTPT